MTAADVADTMRRKPRPGDELELAIEGFDARGHGVAHHDGHRVRVLRGSPGARVRARVLRRRKQVVEAVALEVLAPSPDAAVPRCAHFRACGGCSFQDLAYAAQLEGKRRLVEQALAAHGLLGGGVAVEQVVPAPRAWRYRNKMELTYSARRWIAPAEPQGAESSFALGFHALGLHTKVVDVAACAIQGEVADRILASARELALAQGLAPWDARTHAGLLRHLVLRVAERTGEVLVNLVTSSDAPDLVEPYARALLARHPEITTLAQSVNTRAGESAVGERERVLHGPGAITEVVCGLRLRVSAASFFQTNTLAAEGLLERVRDAAGAGAGTTAWDLYCGTGTIALVLAQRAHAVVGFELVPAAVADARANAGANGIANVRFVEGDVLSGSAAPDLPPPDVVVVDPPRAGLHPRLVPRLAALPARRIVYVACNPVAAARDVAALRGSGWALAGVQPLDLFPHTPHVECVLRLERAP